MYISATGFTICALTLSSLTSLPTPVVTAGLTLVTCQKSHLQILLFVLSHGHYTCTGKYVFNFGTFCLVLIAFAAETQNVSYKT